MMVRTARFGDVGSISSIHIQSLDGSFLSLLGLDFLNQLYRFLIKKEVVFVYEANKEIEGFVSFSFNSPGIMKRFLANSPSGIFLLIIKALQHPGNIKRFWETFRAPSKSKQTSATQNYLVLPSAELLSIAVNPTCQAKGVGGQLLQALEAYLKQKGITQYKVIAGAALESANRFYVKNGFQFVERVNIHGERPSNKYIRNLA